MSYFHIEAKGRTGNPVGVAGDQKNGAKVRIGSYDGYVHVRTYYNKEDGKDWFKITLDPAKGPNAGTDMVLAEGTLDSGKVLYPHFSAQVAKSLEDEPEGA